MYGHSAEYLRYAMGIALRLNYYAITSFCNTYFGIKTVDVFSNIIIVVPDTRAVVVVVFHVESKLSLRNVPTSNSCGISGGLWERGKGYRRVSCHVLVPLHVSVPYDQVDQDSALVEMFGQVGAYKCKYIVAVGALAGLTVSMFGSMFPMPRIVYAMAQDGLIFR